MVYKFEGSLSWLYSSHCPGELLYKFLHLLRLKLAQREAQELQQARDMCMVGTYSGLDTWHASRTVCMPSVYDNRSYTLCIGLSVYHQCMMIVHTVYWTVCIPSVYDDRTHCIGLSVYHQCMMIVHTVYWTVCIPSVYDDRTHCIGLSVYHQCMMIVHTVYWTVCIPSVYDDCTHCVLDCLYTISV